MINDWWCENGIDGDNENDVGDDNADNGDDDDDDDDDEHEDDDSDPPRLVSLTDDGKESAPPARSLITIRNRNGFQ